jgi:hypothetical protein
MLKIVCLHAHYWYMVRNVYMHITGIWWEMFTCTLLVYGEKCLHARYWYMMRNVYMHITGIWWEMFTCTLLVYGEKCLHARYWYMMRNVYMHITGIWWEMFTCTLLVYGENFFFIKQMSTEFWTSSVIVMMEYKWCLRTLIILYKFLNWLYQMLWFFHI